MSSVPSFEPTTDLPAISCHKLANSQGQGCPSWPTTFQIAFQAQPCEPPTDHLSPSHSPRTTLALPSHNGMPTVETCAVKTVPCRVLTLLHRLLLLHLHPHLARLAPSLTHSLSATVLCHAHLTPPVPETLSLPPKHQNTPSALYGPNMCPHSDTQLGDQCGSRFPDTWHPSCTDFA
ncbi:hypothetical protein GQ44DRAFT_368560 [Phaeosphaeriaceae sp. PMI808]|nr:hypothetical protein GQ44DRAFT_368560 [Phaeosphaeriaceae sp. PMI808]